MYEHEVKTVPEISWNGIKNGKLIALINESKFEIFITFDQGIKHQQNIEKISFAIILIKAVTNRWENIEPLSEKIKFAIANSKFKNYQVVE